ncbi:MAG: InlB B-repeat-containing protein [Candidatus Azobacteroides sp.]|nr:InlB B-repeat-containing protein [Candidatus Azobacteroides sp.]
MKEHLERALRRKRLMEPETIEKNGERRKATRLGRNFFAKMLCLLLALCTAHTLFSQTAPAGQFIVVQNGVQQGSSYNTWQEAVYWSSYATNTISQVKNDQGTIIYEQNKNNPKYWLYQANFNSSTTSESSASSWVYTYANAYVFYGDGTVYGARTNGRNTIYKKSEGLESGMTYVYKWSTARADWQSMTATLDLSQCVYATPGYYQQYPGNNLYIYGQLRNSGNAGLGWAEDWGFRKGPQDTKWYFFAAGYTGNYTIGLYDIKNLEWKLEDNNNRFAFYVDGQLIYYKSCNVSTMRQSNMQFLMATTMCPDYGDVNYKTDVANNKDIPADRITNFRDGTFLGNVKWQDCKLKLTNGTVWNFWEEDTQQAIYCNQQTTQLVRQGNSEIITLSRNGSFSTTCNIITSSNPTAGGTTSGGGTKTVGTSCTVNTTVNNGYTFSNWTENGTVVSSTQSYQFTVSPDRNLVANFTPTTLTVSLTNYNFVASGGASSAITVTSNQSWMVSSNASWLTVSPTSGSNNGSFTMTAQPNTSTSSRSAIVTVTGGGKQQQISITQNGVTPSLTVSLTNYNFVASGGTSSAITVTSNQSWTVSSNASWLTTSRTSGSNTNTFTMTATANSSPSSRSATVTVSGGGITRTINVTQDAGADAYEPNDTQSSAYNLGVNFSGNSATINTTGSNFHTNSDIDYYKIDLPSGYNYTVTPRLQDSYSSDNGQTYTVDAKFSYLLNNSSWSSTYDTNCSAISVTNGGTLYFKVEPYYSGNMGTYLLTINITRVVQIPANDQCSNATNLPSNGAPVSGIITGATPTTSVSYSDYGTKNDVFYYFTAANTGNFTITLSNFSDDKDLFLYQDCGTVGALKYSTSTASTETITYTCTAGTTYRIRVTDYSGTGGTFNISLACVPIYTVTLDNQGGTGGTVSVSVLSGSAMPAATAPQKTGYIFGGYFTASNGSGTQYYTDLMESARNWDIMSDGTLFAKWTPITYTVTYYGNGNTGGNTASSSHTYDVEKALTNNGFTKTYTVTYNYNGNGQTNTSEAANYTFAGWATNSGGTVIYSDGQIVSNLTATNGATVPLYAQWNSGYVTLPVATRTGYTFTGWYTAASGGTNTGTGGVAYTPTADITLYAQWIIIPMPTYYLISTSSSPEEGGSTSGGGNIVSGINCTVSATANSGYSFVNWTENGAEVSTNTDYQFEVSANRNLVANFTATCKTPPDYDYDHDLTPPTTAGQNRWINTDPGKCFIYRVSVTSGTKYGISTSPAATYAFNAKEYLYDNSGTLLASSSANDGSENIEYQFDYSGYAYVKIEGESSGDFWYSCIIEPVIYAMAESGGIISPNSLVTVYNGNDETFTFTPNQGYEINQVLVNGVVNPRAKMDGYYTFSNITENQTISVTFTSIKEEGVILNGIKWATRNVGSPGTFAANIESAGMFYQWNRKVGWSTNDPLVNSDGDTNWDTSLIEGDTWTAENDPCPTGWRVPTLPEIQGLLGIGQWTTVNGVNGRKFNDQNNGNNIFLPAVGTRYNDGRFDEPDNGYYRTSWLQSDNAAYFTFDSGGDGWNQSHDSRDGMCVRCVAESFTLTASAGDGGSISPNGAQAVYYGDSKKFEFMPDEGYETGKVLVNGVDEPEAKANGYYTFTNITENQTIEVTFVPVNDQCVNAVSLSCGTTVQEALAGATPTTSVIYDDGADRADVFYKFTADIAGDYSVMLTKHNIDDDINLYVYSDCSATSPLVKLIDAEDGLVETKTLESCTAGTTYLLRAIDWSYTGGSFDILLTCPDKPENGVVINGVKWATRNVDRPGTFAANPESAGMFYQWNRNVGWSTTDPLVNSDGDTTWDTSLIEGDTWTDENDPCPTGWRVPTLTEIYGLSSSQWTTVNGVNGRVFTDQINGNSIFLPAVGFRNSDGALIDTSMGWYWTNVKNADNNNPCFITLNDTFEGWDVSHDSRDGMSVRCVKKTEIPSTYGVSIGTFSGGSVSTDKTDAAVGETVTLTILPDEGYELNTISAYKTGDESTTIDTTVPNANTRTFTMPDYGVTVTATFKKTVVEIAKDDIESASYRLTQATANTESDIKEELVSLINALIAPTGITISTSDINPSCRHFC